MLVEYGGAACSGLGVERTQRTAWSGLLRLFIQPHARGSSAMVGFEKKEERMKNE